MTAALSRYAERTPAGFFACVLRIIANSDFGCRSPSMIQSALKILCRSAGVRLREHHELDIGGCAVAPQILHQVIDRRPTTQAAQEFAVTSASRRRQRHRAQGASLFLDEGPRRIAALSNAARPYDRTTTPPGAGPARVSGDSNPPTTPSFDATHGLEPHTCAMSVAWLAEERSCRGAVPP